MWLSMFFNLDKSAQFIYFCFVCVITQTIITIFFDCLFHLFSIRFEWLKKRLCSTVHTVHCTYIINQRFRRAIWNGFFSFFFFALMRVLSQLLMCVCVCALVIAKCGNMRIIYSFSFLSLFHFDFLSCLDVHFLISSLFAPTRFFFAALI